MNASTFVARVIDRPEPMSPPAVLRRGCNCPVPRTEGRPRGCLNSTGRGLATPSATSSAARLEAAAHGIRPPGLPAETAGSRAPAVTAKELGSTASRSPTHRKGSPAELKRATRTGARDECPSSGRRSCSTSRRWPPHMFRRCSPAHGPPAEARNLGAERTGRLILPSARYVGPAHDRYARSPGGGVIWVTPRSRSPMT